MTRDEDMFGACTTGDAERVAALLAREPSLVAARDAFIGSTPLHFAAHRGFADIVALLLAHGADVGAREAVSGTLPLHWACEGGHAPVAAHLLAAGSALDVRDRWHDLEPLGWATVVDHEPAFRADRAAVVDLLLARGAPLDAFTALARGDAAAARALPAAAWRRKLGIASRGATPLHAAAVRGDIAAVRLALECGADAAAIDDWGVTPRAAAVAGGHAEVAAELAAHAPALDAATAIALHDWEAAAASSPDLASAPYASLVHWALGRRDLEALRQLLDRGADPNVLTSDLHGDSLLQLTPLHVAAKRGDVEAVRLLLDRGADPDRVAIGGTGHTPLHTAAAADAPEVAALLLARGADRGLRDARHDATALEWARFFHHDRVAAAIEDAP